LEAITKGLLSSPSKPAFLIHLSGTGIVADWHDPTYLGKLGPKVWSDISNIDEITSRPDGELHRKTEKYLQSVIAKHHNKLKIAIICPPDIYGPGRGPGRQQSVYFPVFVKEMEKVGPPFYVGEGTNTRSWVHIEDLMTVYSKLVEAAVAGGGNVDWGKEVTGTHARCMHKQLLTVPGLLLYRFPRGVSNRYSHSGWQDPQAPRPNRGWQPNPAPTRTSQLDVGSLWP
jgi:nucleoside-diphosphate-sugar epimerase